MRRNTNSLVNAIMHHRNLTSLSLKTRLKPFGLFNVSPTRKHTASVNNSIVYRIPLMQLYPGQQTLVKISFPIILAVLHCSIRQSAAADEAANSNENQRNLSVLFAFLSLIAIIWFGPPFIFRTFNSQSRLLMHFALCALSMLQVPCVRFLPGQSLG